MTVLKLVLECTAHECVVGNQGVDALQHVGVRLPGTSSTTCPRPYLLSRLPAPSTRGRVPALPPRYFVPGPGPRPPALFSGRAGTQFKFVPAHAVRGW